VEIALLLHPKTTRGGHKTRTDGVNKKIKASDTNISEGWRAHEDQIKKGMFLAK
jgi:hypothetical protein